MPNPHHRHTAFIGHRRLAGGALDQVALAVHRAVAADPDASVLVFSDATGRQVDLDVRGTPSEVLARYARPRDEPPAETRAEPVARGRGRPRLGVVAREVTLLPEHWDWLAAQPGGSSVALRKLVHQARRSAAGRPDQGKARERAYAFMAAVAGDLPGFEEATRALFAGDHARLAELTARWPADVREHVARLADAGEAAAEPPVD